MQVKKLVFAALLCGGIAQLGTGCIITTNEPDPILPDPDPTTISATWQFLSGDGNDPVLCPGYATTVELITEDSFGDQIVDQFECGKELVAVERNPGTYDVWVRLTDDTHVPTYAQSLSAVVALDEGYDTPIDFVVSIDRASFFFSWEITDNAAAADCDVLGIGNVAVTSTLVGDGSTAYDEEATCAYYEYTTEGMVLGTYTVSIALLDTENAGAVYVADSVEETLRWGNDFVNLGNFVLDAAGN
jgi:hypothetical protein